MDVLMFIDISMNRSLASQHSFNVRKYGKLILQFPLIFHELLSFITSRSVIDHVVKLCSEFRDIQGSDSFEYVIVITWVVRLYVEIIHEL